MANPLIPFVRGGSYYASRSWIPFVRENGLTTQSGEGEEPWHWKTVSGKLISIVDALAGDVQALVASISPTQDLHGYDSPWPAGGGKNRAEVTQDSGTSGEVTFTAVKDESGNILWLKASGTITVNANITIASVVITSDGLYRFSGLTNGSNTTAVLQLRDSSDNIISTRATDESGDLSLTAGTYHIVYRVLAGANISNMEIKPMVRLSSSEAGFAPYSNICPITGQTGVTVYRTGVNVWDEEWEHGSLKTDGSEDPSITLVRAKYYIPVVGGQTYYVHGSTAAVSAGGCFYIHYYDKDKNHITSSALSHTNFDYRINANTTAPANACFIRFRGNGNITASNIEETSINYPSTDHDYHAYTGTTIPVTFPTPPGTVYGGSLDLVSGVLTVDRAIISKKYSELTTASGTPPAGFAYLSYGRLPSTGDYEKRASSLCNLCSYNDKLANPNVFRMTSNSNYIYLTLPIGLDPDTDATTVYPLATPLTYQLSPQEVQTLVGQNNVWQESGDTVTLTYMAEGNE